MGLILTASNSEILRLLGSRACARLGLAREIVRTGREALDTARRLRPQIAILEADMDDIDGLEVCRQIKADPQLAGCRVMLVVAGVLSREALDQLASTKCDDVLVMPAIGEEFFSHVADLLGVPRRRSRRVAVEIMTRIEGSNQTVDGCVENLSTSGARVRLQQPLGKSDAVKVRLTSPRGSRATVLDARVVWRREEGQLVGLEFQQQSRELHEQLAGLTLWDIVEEDDLVRVYLDGDLVETTDLDPLAKKLSGRVEFDAAGVRYINSQGTRVWISFLSQLTGVTEYTFSRCSTPFTTQASMLVDFIGRGRIASFMAPYHCDRCDRDEARLVQTSAVATEDGCFTPPRFACPKCQEVMSLDEIPERYFAFLIRA
jgi:CheY-like chemotaxis protein